MTTQYQRGQRFAWKVRDQLRDDGYQVFVTAGSKTPADLIALKYGETLLVQAKRTSGTIPPAERVKLVDLAALVGAIPIVAHRPIPQKPIRYRRLTGWTAKEWEPWTPDQVGAA